VDVDSYWIYGILSFTCLAGIALLGFARTILQSLDDSDIETLSMASSKQLTRLRSIISGWPLTVLSLQYGIVAGFLLLLFFTFKLCQHSVYILSVSFTSLLFAAFCILIVLLFLADFFIIPALNMKRQKLASLIAMPVSWYVAACGPLVRFKQRLQGLIFNDAESHGIQPHRSYHMFRGIEGSEHIGRLDENEREMIHSIFEFGETEVHEIMVPRPDIISADGVSSIDDVTKLMKEKGHSRLPLYREDIDHILGVIHIKDLLPLVLSSDSISLAEIARPAYFVPESKKLDQLLKEFQREKHHMAIVVDEYGGTAGLVTLEDVLEEIVGDIQDEYDREAPLYQKIDEHTFSVNAKIDLHELNEDLDLKLPTEGEYDSLGGFILSLTGYVPSQNEIVEYDGIKFVVEKITGNRIVRVKLSWPEISVHDIRDSKQDQPGETS
jgi:CBS domain containing-hemolysin-like protein